MATDPVTNALRRIPLAAFLLLSFTGWLAAQCPVKNLDDDLPPDLPTVNSSTRHGEPQLPESGYLSNTSYASTYFGFIFNLPLPLEGHRLMMPLMPAGQHALLAEGFQQGRRSGTLFITASEPNNPVHEMTEAERKAEFQAWAKGDPRHDITPPDWLTRTGRFYHIAQHKGDVTTVQYWTFIKNYLIRIKVESNDRDFLSLTKLAVGNVKFYCAQDDGTVIDEQGKIVPTPGEGYQGPTIPTSLVDAALDEQPALGQIPMGESSPGKYTNEEIGLTYTYPATWDVAKSAPDLTPGTEVEQRTRDVLSACSLVLLRLAPSAAEEAKAGPQAAVAQNITLRAVDQTCLGLPAPASVTDRLSAEKLGAYLQMLGAFGELRSTNLVMRGGHLFAEYSGVVGENPENQPLLQRRNEAVAITRHRKLLLIWSWIAPNTTLLTTLPMTSVSFEGDPPIDLLAASVVAQH
jgi:hypothetical protein